MALRFTRLATLCGALVLGCVLMAAPVQAIHPRPKSASPIQMSLVPAYAACAAPNRTHGPPLAFGSCNPAAQTSAQATVGTPDAFGGGANSTGYLQLKYLPCPLGHCPPDSDDVQIDIALTDVRCVSTGARCGADNASGPADYSGEMRLSLSVRLTDHWNATAPGGGLDAATVQDFVMDLPPPTASAWACAQSGSTASGSTCDLHTTLMTLMPGAVKDSRRAIWALDLMRILDGGADGVAETAADNTVFMRPGVFIP